MGYTCFVYGCRSGSDRDVAKRKAAGKKKLTLFCAPRDPQLLKKWNHRLKRADRDLRQSDRVCELHFESKYVSRYFPPVTMPDGFVCKLKKERPTLSKNAIPMKCNSGRSCGLTDEEYDNDDKEDEEEEEEDEEKEEREEVKGEEDEKEELTDDACGSSIRSSDIQSDVPEPDDLDELLGQSPGTNSPPTKDSNDYLLPSDESLDADSSSWNAVSSSHTQNKETNDISIKIEDYPVLEDSNIRRFLTRNNQEHDESNPPISWTQNEMAVDNVTLTSSTGLEIPSDEEAPPTIRDLKLQISRNKAISLTAMELRNGSLMIQDVDLIDYSIKKRIVVGVNMTTNVFFGLKKVNINGYNFISNMKQFNAFISYVRRLKICPGAFNPDNSCRGYVAKGQCCPPCFGSKQKALRNEAFAEERRKAETERRNRRRRERAKARKNAAPPT